MRWKFLLAAVALSLFPGFCSLPSLAQVAPSAKVSGIPLFVSVGVSDYQLDYGSGRRMQGLVIRAGYELFHGVGVDFDARSIFMNTPPELTRMQQNTFLGGVYYEARPIFHVRPFVRWGAGLGTIEFPSRNPLYTRDSYTVYAPSGGVEIPVMDKLAIRGEYEYQFWKQYHGPNDLTPQGYTIGVTYALGGRHLRPHPRY
jgi:opacity protein-like surface antigen